MRHSTTAVRGRRARRGMAMVGIMLVLMGVLTITLLGSLAAGRSGGSGVMTNTGNSIQMAGARAQSTSAFNLAESGLEYTLQWLNSLPQPPAQTAAFTPAFVWTATDAAALRAPVVLDPARPGDAFKVVVYPDAVNRPTGLVTGSPDKSFLVESVGASGGQTVILQAYVRTTSLSKWLVLVDKWTADNYWVSGLSTFDGPVHDNNFGATGAPNGLLENVAWYDANGSRASGWVDAAGNPVAHPLFTYSGNDAYESSGSGVNWFRNNSFGATSAPAGDDWKYVAAGGRNSVSYGASTVPFPSDSARQQYAALGLPPPSGGGPAAPPAVPAGVSVNPGGGITVGGDVDQMTLSADPANAANQLIEVYQRNAVTGREDYTKITLNTATNRTVLQKGSVPAGQLTNAGVTLNPVQPPPVIGLTNGVVYCDGNVGAQGDPKTGGLSGVIADNAVNAGTGAVTHANKLTIATDLGKNLNIDGSLTYKTARQRDAAGNYRAEADDPTFVQKAGTLGVVSNNILITQKAADGSTLGDIETNGSFFANGVFDVDHYRDRAARNWENMGGYLSRTVGVFGVFSSSTGQIVRGMNNQFNYDARMRDNPPPFYPTGGNQYDVLSWKRVSQTLDGSIQG